MIYEKYQLLTAESILLIIGVFLFIRSWVVCTKDFDSRINNIPDEWIRNRCRNTEKAHKYFALVGLGLGLVLSMISLFYLLHTSFFTVPTQTHTLFYIEFFIVLFFMSALLIHMLNFFVEPRSFGINFNFYIEKILSEYKKNNFMLLDNWDKAKSYDMSKKDKFLENESYWINRYQQIVYQIVLLYYLAIILTIIYLCTIETAYYYILAICSLIFN